MVAAMEDEYRRSSGAISPSDSLEDDVVVVITAAVLEAGEDGEDESLPREVTPDGGIFSGASEASAASNDCEFKFSRCRADVPFSGKGMRVFLRGRMPILAACRPCRAPAPTLKSGKSLIRG